MKFKKTIAALLLVGAVSINVGKALPSYATDWKQHEIDRINEQQRRRAKELERDNAREAEDRLRRMRYEEERKRDLQRKLDYQNKRK